MWNDGIIASAETIEIVSYYDIVVYVTEFRVFFFFYIIYLFFSIRVEAFRRARVICVCALFNDESSV